MLDPEFEPGTVHTATLVVTNPTKWHWEYQVELFLAGTSLGSQDIALEAYGSSSLSWSVTMPAVEGTYSVYAIAKCTTTGQSLGRFDFESITIKPIIPFDPWDYDTNGDGYIDIDELLSAIGDYLAGEIPIGLLLEVIDIYMGGVPPPPPPTFDPWDYDIDGSCYIEIGELLDAISDYIGGSIDISSLLEVIDLYMNHTRNPAC